MIAVLKTVLTVIFVIVCIVLNIVILSQEGKDAGLGSLSGQASNTDSYWSKNKGRPREGVLIKLTTILVIVYFVVSAALNMGLFN